MKQIMETKEDALPKIRAAIEECIQEESDDLLFAVMQKVNGRYNPKWVQEVIDIVLR